MIEYLEKLMGIKWNRDWLLKFFLSLAAPLILVLLRPLELDQRQSLIVAILLLTVIWWSAGIYR